jgi:hypothetical protein
MKETLVLGKCQAMAINAGQPGTTTPLPPWAIDGGLPTKRSQERRLNSRCAALRIDDLADLGWIIWREPTGRRLYQGSKARRRGRTPHA